MSGVTHGSRLEQLEALRDRIDKEITAERRKAAERGEGVGIRTNPTVSVAQVIAGSRQTISVTPLVIKRWAFDQGLIPAVARGRVAQSLVDAYAQAHGFTHVTLETAR